MYVRLLLTAAYNLLLSKMTVETLFKQFLKSEEEVKAR
jgi:hypothetical protein